MSGLDRRAFLRRMALASAATAASSLIPGIAFGEEMAHSPKGGRGVTWKKSPCRFCAVGCGLLIGIENGRAVAVRGDPDSPVSRGLACVKGYHSVQALYGQDRITRARVRRGGQLVEVPIQEALDLVAERLDETVEEHGKDGVALYGSGQWSITDGYAASKLFKGGLGTNNLEASTRLYTGSAMEGLRATFGMDAPPGCYEDVDHADVFVLWGANMAETHPVLFSRMLQRRQVDETVRIVDLSTRSTRTSYAADRSLVYAPHSDLAIANAVCHELIARGRTDRGFVDAHVSFWRGPTGIGHDRAEGGAEAHGEGQEVGWDEFADFLADYTPARAEEISGVPAEEIRWLASLYGDPSRRVMTLWASDVNRHVRGTWMNNLLYNIHLLTGRVSTPGDGPLALEEQPSGAGTAREVGTFAHRLPAGDVGDPEARRKTAAVWGVPEGGLDPEPGHDTVSLFRALEAGEVRFLWVQATNPLVSLPDLSRYREAAEKEDRFVVVSEAYPTPTSDVADVVLPAAVWVEREGLFGSGDRRTQHFEQMLEPPGDAMSDARQLVEVARRLGLGDLLPWDEGEVADGVWEELEELRQGPRTSLPPLDQLRAAPGLRWPWVDGRETKWRYSTKRDPAADPDRGEFDFYGHPDHRARIWLRPYEPPAEAPDDEYPFWLATGRVLEHWGSGTMTRRIPTLHQAVPRAYVELNRQDAEELGIRSGEMVRLTSRRGTVAIEARMDYRTQPPRGQVFVPDFDEERLVHELTLDAHCPLSGQPDTAKCAVRVERMAGELP